MTKSVSLTTDAQGSVIEATATTIDINGLVTEDPFSNTNASYLVVGDTTLATNAGYLVKTLIWQRSLKALFTRPLAPVAPMVISHRFWWLT